MACRVSLLGQSMTEEPGSVSPALVSTGNEDSRVCFTHNYATADPSCFLVLLLTLHRPAHSEPRNWLNGEGVFLLRGLSCCVP